MQRITDGDARFAERERRLHDLLVSALGGDSGAYQHFLKTLSEHLRAYFRKRLFGRPDEVEDLVQETLLGVHNQRHTYRIDQPLTAWVHAIARYKLIDSLRANATRDALTEPLDDELEVFAESDVEANEAKTDLGKLLMSLPDKQRLPIQYVKIDGLSVMEAAQRTGLSESAVKVGVHRGLKALAAQLRGSS